MGPISETQLTQKSLKESPACPFCSSRILGLDRLPCEIPPVLQRQTAVWTTLSRPPDLIPSEGHPVLYSQRGHADRKQKRPGT